MGAVFAKLESTADDTAITDQMTKDTWIGLNSATLTWVSDSSDLGSYTNWYGAKNPGTNLNQKCVIKKVLTSDNPNQGKWDDVGCKKDLPYACSMPSTCG